MIKKRMLIAAGMIVALSLVGCKNSVDNGGTSQPSSITYTLLENGNGGLEGTSTQTQGQVVKESWMDNDGNLKFTNASSQTVVIPKTSEVVVIPTGTVAYVTMPNDSSWSTYYSGSDRYYKGVFLSGRKVKLDPFVMSRYQVTQKLYQEVMGINPSNFSSNPYGEETQNNRPVEKVTWYQACAFCNELTKKTFGDTTDQCVYYNEQGSVYTISDADNKKAVVVEGQSYNTTDKKWIKTGYRLPTEAEWEFAARGGDPNAVDINGNSIWSYAYAGVQTAKQASRFTSGSDDTPLQNYGWFTRYSNSKTHEVGLKTANTLNLYDMSGNVYEWCYDWYNTDATSNDTVYTADGYVVNPLGASASFADGRCSRGGNYSNSAYYCSVSYRNYNGADNFYLNLGFRVCRSNN